MQTKTFNGMRIEEADTNIHSMVDLAALGSERKRVFSQKLSKVKTLRINFADFWDILSQAFIRTPNITFERHKLLNRRQRVRERLEQFWGSLA